MSYFGGLLKKIAVLQNFRYRRQLMNEEVGQLATWLEQLRQEAAALVAAQPELPFQAAPAQSLQQRELTAIHAAKGTPQQAPLVRRFCERNLGLAYDYAGRWQCAEIPLYELRQEAVVGMLEAVHAWEPGHGPGFAGFALWKMRARLQEYVRKKWPIVHLPGNVRADQHKVAAAARQLRSKHGCDPTPAALGLALPELTAKRLEVALAYVGGVQVGSLDAIGAREV